MTRFPVRKSKQIISAALALLSIQYSIPALADEQDAFNLLLGVDVKYEDNLFRVDDNTPLGNASKHDLTHTYSAGFKFDKMYSLQRIQVDATVTENKYQENSFLDWTGFNYRAAWLWQLTPRISGTLLATRNETLNSFGDFRRIDPNAGTPRNLQSIQTNEREEFTADVLLWGGWHIVGGVSTIDSRNSQSFNEIGDFSQDSAEFGGRYVFPSGTEITLVQRESTGDYKGRAADPFRQLDTGYDQSETEGKIDWRVTGKSHLTAKLGYVDREHDNFTQRDYDGLTGLLAWRWMPTGKLLVNTAISRNIYSFQESNFAGLGFLVGDYSYSYYVADTFTWSPLWAITDKTSLRFRYDLSDRDFRGNLDPTSPSRRDILRSYTLTAEWQALRTLLVSAVARHEDRDSDRTDFDYKADSIGISAQLLF